MKVELDLTLREAAVITNILQVAGAQRLADKVKVAFVDAQIKAQRHPYAGQPK